MIVSKKLIGAGAEKYLPFALSKLRQYAKAWTGRVRNHNFNVDDGTTIMIELYAENRGHITIIALSGFIVLGDKRTNYLTASLAKTQLFMGAYKSAFRLQGTARSFTDTADRFQAELHFMSWQQVQPVPNSEAIVALAESVDFVDSVAVMHISKAGKVTTKLTSTPHDFHSSPKVFCLGPSDPVDHPGKYRYLFLVGSGSRLSEDSGATWSASALPTGTFFSGDFIGNGTVLIFMASFDTTSHVKLYRTEDGVSWALTNVEYGAPFPDFGVTGRTGQIVPLGNDRVLLVESTAEEISEQTSVSVTVAARLSVDGGSTFGVAGGAVVSGEQIQIVQTLALGTDAAAILVLDLMTFRATIYLTSDAGVSWIARELPEAIWSPQDFFGPASYHFKYLTLASTPTKLLEGPVDIDSLVLLLPVIEYSAAADAAGAATAAAFQGGSVATLAFTTGGDLGSITNFMDVVIANRAGSIDDAAVSRGTSPTHADFVAAYDTAVANAVADFDNASLRASHAVDAVAFAVDAAARAVTLAIPANATAAATAQSDTIAWAAAVDATVAAVAAAVSAVAASAALSADQAADQADADAASPTPTTTTAEAAGAAGAAAKVAAEAAEAAGNVALASWSASISAAADAANATAGTPTVFAYYTKDGGQTWTKGGAIAKNIESNIMWSGDRGFASIEALTETGNLAFSNFYSDNGVLV